MIVTIVKNKNTIFLGVICFLICIILLIAGLWPFNFNPENKVRWLSDENGVLFYGRGMIYSSGPLNSPDHPQLKDAITVEVSLRAISEATGGLPRILTFYDDNKSESLFVGQWKSELILRCARNVISPQSKRRSYKEMGISNALTNDTRRFVTITLDAQGIALYLDGKFANSYSDFLPHSISMRSLKYLALGNSTEGKRYWKGYLYSLAIYNRSLNPGEVSQNYISWKQRGSPPLTTNGLIALYLFDEGSGHTVRDHKGSTQYLTVPGTFQPLQKTVLSLPWSDFHLSRSYLTDVAVNVIGFVPYGFFFTAFFLKVLPFARGRVYIITLLLGGVISFAIELLQVYLPTRYSSLTDVICNISGSAMGIIIFASCQRLLACRKKRRPFSNYHP